MLVFFSIYIFCSFTALNMLLILIACDFVSMYPSHSQKGKNVYFATGNFLPFATIFFSGQDDLKQQLFERSIPLQLLWQKKEVQLRFHLKMKTYLTQRMLQVLMTTLYKVSLVQLWLQSLLKCFLFHQFQECKQMWRIMLIHCMTTLKDIWPVMTLFYDYNMLFID